MFCRKPLALTVFFLLFLSLFLSLGQIATASAFASSSRVRCDTLTLFDPARKRKIPIALYGSSTQSEIPHQKLVILSHGYNQNQPGSYLRYSYLAENLASKGYFVVSIQHELPTDSLIPSKGTVQLVRRPFWDRGADNILFVLHYLKQSKPFLDFKHVALVGHSNGGDIVALFPQKYPRQVAKVITLDNRRMPLPRTKKNPQVYSLRSSDQAADEGVLPTFREGKHLRMTIIPLLLTKHDDMDDSATLTQRHEINEYIFRFLKH
jgi:dienelactone hydrolase